MTDEEREDLVNQLEMESKTIRLKFSSLVSKTATVINYTSSDLKTFFSGCGMKELASKIDSSDPISTTLRCVHESNVWSFFDYELLEQIIYAFCKDEEIVKVLKAYITDFKCFCERRLYEIPVETFAMKLPHVHSNAKISIKIDNEFFGEETNIKNLGGEQIPEEEN